MGTAESIEYCIESLKHINENKDKSIKNLLDENIRLHTELMTYRYAAALVFVAAVIACALVG
jgi:hypothetical protein